MTNEVSSNDTQVASPRRQKFWPITLATALAFVFLVSLGIWQLQRLAWKEGLIAEIAARQSAPPVSIAEVLNQQRDGKDIRYLRVQATGTFLHNHERYFYAPDAKLGPGVDVITPFELTDGRGLIMVNRGFVPEPLQSPEKRTDGQVSDTQEVVGLVRLPGRSGAFTPDNNAEKNLWFWRDFDAMSKDVPRPSDAGPSLKLFIDAEQAAPGGWPRGGVRKIELSNRHFGYAMTWFGLALTLLGVYAALMWGRRKT